eukprot:m.73473 g.73473  ORF g.73473 m.73473 type:complete len:493 (+) comp7724_c0_seq1:147-1625(+)
MSNSAMEMQNMSSDGSRLGSQSASGMGSRAESSTSGAGLLPRSGSGRQLPVPRAQPQGGAGRPGGSNLNPGQDRAKAPRQLSPEEAQMLAQFRQQQRQQIEERRRAHAEAQQQQIEEEERQLELKYGAYQVIALIIPVSLCMVCVIAVLKSVSYYSQGGQQFAYTPYQENGSSSSSQQFGGALLNVIIIIAIIVVMTLVLVVLYKYRCYKGIHAWLLMSSILLLFFFSYEFLTEILQSQNVTMDYITMSITVWNFGLVGLLVIHWKGPLLLQQGYLIAVSVLMALVLIKFLPDWTTWILLGAIAIYDLVAVLCPFGPLRVLVETAQERDEPLFPALVYSSTMVWLVGMADPPAYQGPPQTPPSGARNSIGNSAQSSAPRPGTQPQSPIVPAQPSVSAEEEEEAKGVKLGLGDFIFYSVLVGKAATLSDWGTIFVCYIAILIGLACTLLLLSIIKRALPALPISICLGLIFYFITSLLLTPYLDALSYNQVFI